MLEIVLDSQRLDRAYTAEQTFTICVCPPWFGQREDTSRRYGQKSSKNAQVIPT